MPYNSGVGTFIANFPEDLLKLAPTHTFVTPNDRLAREHRRAWDVINQNRKTTTWKPLDSLSVTQFFLREYHRAVDAGADIPPLLTQDDLLIHAHNADTGLNPGEIQTLLDAWHLANTYDIELEQQPAILRSPRARSCLAHLNRVASNFTLVEAIPDALATRHLTPHRPVFLDHVDQMTHPQERYLALLTRSERCLQRASFISAEEVDAQEIPLQPDTPRSMVTKACTDLGAELDVACMWALETKAREPLATIGIVVPALTQHYDTVRYRCGRILDPRNGSLSPVFDISGGTPLAHHGVWKAAEAVLETAIHGADNALQELLLASPYLQLKWLDTVIARLPVIGDAAPTLATLAHRANHPAAEKIREETRSWSQKAPLYTWSRRFQSVLELAGWPDPGNLGSAQHQAWQAIEEVRLQLSRTTTDLNVSADEAFGLLKHALSRRIHAPERAHADIQLLGLLEATGLKFSHLWVCGLDAETFPSTSRINPYISRRVGTLAGIPRYSPEDELRFCRRTLEHWMNGAAELRFSFSIERDESTQQPSPFITEHLKDADTAERCQNLNPGTQALEEFIDETGTTIDSGVTRGGISLLADQAACPFRAYARHRLGFTSPRSPQMLPDAMTRGIYVHEVLHALFNEYRDSASLSKITQARILELSDGVLASITPEIPASFVEHERQRILLLVEDWLLHEQARGDFEIQYLEHTAELDLNGLLLTIRLDRVDRTSADDWIVIDYKTGPSSLSGALEPPLTNPQLPIYSLTDDRIRGVFYALVLSDRSRSVGIAESTDLLPASRVKVVSWDEQVDSWRTTLAETADQYRQGFASVQPHPGACAYCELKSLCRVEELSADV